MRIFFDLDGTLIDSRERLYKLFQHLVKKSHLTFDEYWKLKRDKVNHKDILINRFFYSQEEYDAFEKEWMNKIELPEWLAFDQPFNGITEHLAELSRQHALYIITARQFTDRALEQVHVYGWSDFFREILVTNQQKDKEELLKALVPEKNDWLVGDTGHDIQTGKKLGMKTAGVLSGFMNKEKLLEYQPDLLLNNARDFII